MSATERRLAIVTGAGGAIGAAFACVCAEEGFAVIPVHRRPRTDEESALWADFESVSELEALCGRIAEFERLSLLVHAAGSYERGSIEAVPRERYERMYRVNVEAAHVLTRAALPALRAARGTVVFVNSSVVMQDGPREVTAYAMTKAALRALANGLRAEENRHGVGVLSVYPGRTAGMLQQRLHDAEGRRYSAEDLLQPDDVARAVLDAVALPATAEVTDLHIRPRRPPL